MKEAYLLLSNQKESALQWWGVLSHKSVDKIKETINENKKAFEENSLDINEFLNHLKAIQKLPLVKRNKIVGELDYYCKKDPEVKNSWENGGYCIPSPVHFSTDRFSLNPAISLDDVENSWKYAEEIKEALKYIETIDEKLKLNLMTNLDYTYSVALSEVEEICKIKNKIKNGRCDIKATDLINDLTKTYSYAIYVSDSFKEGYLSPGMTLTTFKNAKMFKNERDAEKFIGKSEKGKINFGNQRTSFYIVKNKIIADNVFKVIDYNNENKKSFL